MEKRRNSFGRIRNTNTSKITHAQEVYASWGLDILIYVIVLNLFVEYVDAIKIDSFSISILTAILLTALIALIKRIEHRIYNFFAEKKGVGFRALGLISVFFILFVSKLFILEVVNLVFGDHVELGHFVEIIALILAMLVARQIVTRIYDRLGIHE